MFSVTRAARWRPDGRTSTTTVNTEPSFSWATSVFGGFVLGGWCIGVLVFGVLEFGVREALALDGMSSMGAWGRHEWHEQHEQTDGM